MQVHLPSPRSLIQRALGKNGQFMIGNKALINIASEKWIMINVYIEELKK